MPQSMKAESGRRMTVGHVAERLRGEIERQKLAPGTLIHSNRRICELFGVSPMTATRAVNRLVDEGLLHRIKGSGTYIGKAAGAAGQKIGLLFHLPSLAGSQETEVAYGILRDAVAERVSGCGDGSVELSYNDVRSGSTAPSVLRQLDAVVVAASCVDHDTMRQLDAWGKPVVLVQLDEPRDLPYHQVFPDLYQGFSAAARLFKTAGAARIATLGIDAPTSCRRTAIFQCAAEAAGMDATSFTAFNAPCEIGDSGRLAGFRTGLKLLKENTFDAIFCPSDFVSFGFVDACREKGVEPGKDILLISYDDFEGEGLLPFGEPLLTSVSNPRREIGRIAADLVRSSSLKEAGVAHLLKVRTKLVRRKTA